MVQFLSGRSGLNSDVTPVFREEETRPDPESGHFVQSISDLGVFHQACYLLVVNLPIRLLKSYRDTTVH